MSIKTHLLSVACSGGSGGTLGEAIVQILKVVCRVIPSDGINTRKLIPWDFAPIWSLLPTGRDSFHNSGIKRWIYLHSCLSTWLQRWSMEMTSTVGCLRLLLLTARWSWSGNVLCLMSVTLERREPGSLVSAELSFWPAFKHVDIACQITANVQKSDWSE